MEKLCTLKELSRDYSVKDLFDFHEALDLKFYLELTLSERAQKGKK